MVFKFSQVPWKIDYLREIWYLVSWKETLKYCGRKPSDESRRAPGPTLREYTNGFSGYDGQKTRVERSFQARLGRVTIGNPRKS
jgi:hypothetical protein